MELIVLFFLSSGLFLGWSLGANDAANVFGTAVGSRMVKFGTAALICSVMVILGAVISGAGAAHTLGALGSVNALGGSFMAAFSAALTVLWMTKLGLPVSTSQAVVGAIIGWNFYSGSVTDLNALYKILGTWVACPLLAAVFGVLLFKLMEKVLAKTRIHLLHIDAYTRWGLILAGAFGAYALGANNIANVMGVFVASSPFTDFQVANLFVFSSIEQLFLIGGIAIAVGVYTYSKNVMMTVGGGIVPLSPVASWVVVIAQSLVLFLFASEGLEHTLASAGLPTIPLVPVSSSQAVVGAVIGIGLLKGGDNIRWEVLGRIGGGWLATPVISAVLCFFMLFFLQNVFNQKVYEEIRYELSGPVLERLAQSGLDTGALQALQDQEYPTALKFRKALRKQVALPYDTELKVISYAEIDHIRIDPAKFALLDKGWLSQEQVDAVAQLAGRNFEHKWVLVDELSKHSPAWQLKEATKVNKPYNKEIKDKLEFVVQTFTVHPE